MTTYNNRAAMVRDLPGELHGVEVGVQRGEFSAEIALFTERLYLVDPWRHIGGKYAKDPADLDDGGHESNFRFVMERFHTHALLGRVSVHRCTSLEAACMFSLGSLDFVYLDANHTYDAVLEDLFAWEGKIKPGGCLMGHDYVDNERSRAMGFGVVRAVFDFCQRKPWQLVASTAEEWPSFKLMRA